MKLKFYEKKKIEAKHALGTLTFNRLSLKNESKKKKTRTIPLAEQIPTNKRASVSISVEHQSSMQEVWGFNPITDKDFPVCMMPALLGSLRPTDEMISRGPVCAHIQNIKLAL
jgi:hypothetical protein